jgi:hypothetical protein
MNKARKQIIAKIIKEDNLSKIAQEAIESVQQGDPQEGERVAEQIFDQLMEGIKTRIDSLS